MLVRLDTPYVDTHAGLLCFALGLPPQPALHRYRPAIPGPATGSTVELRLLDRGMRSQLLRPLVP